MADLDIVVLAGDGVGPEVTAAAVRVLEALCARHGHALRVRNAEIGYVAYERHGTPLPDETLATCLSASALLLGAVGDPRADALLPVDRPEGGLLRLRSELGTFANLRPAKIDPSLVHASALRPEIVTGCDFMIVHELTGGIYYGTPRGDAGGGRVINTMVYTEAEVERIARVGFEVARMRRKKVTSVDKANVLEVSRLWRATVNRVAAEYPDVALDHMLVDRAAMELVLAPSKLDVVLTANLFGDILSDEAAAVCGTLGVLGSACIGGDVGLYEPVHGSAPDIAGQGRANPIGALASCALMLTHTFRLIDEANELERAISGALGRGLRTADLATRGEAWVGTDAFTAGVLEELT